MTLSSSYLTLEPRGISITAEKEEREDVAGEGEMLEKLLEKMGECGVSKCIDVFIHTSIDNIGS